MRMNGRIAIVDRRGEQHWKRGCASVCTRRRKGLHRGPCAQRCKSAAAEIAKEGTSAMAVAMEVAEEKQVKAGVARMIE